MDDKILALAAFLQSQLDVLVITPKGCYEPVSLPSSLVTIEPFCPGGLQRLALNVNFTPVREVDCALKAGQEDSVRKLG